VIYAKASHLNIPIYILHGTGDGIVNSEGSKKLFEMVTVQDKTLKLYDGLYHETFNELPKIATKCWVNCGSGSTSTNAVM